MRISAASLTEARINPGHLAVNKVVALAGAMGEHPLRVLADLLTEAAAKKRRERKKQGTQLSRQPSGPQVSIGGGGAVSKTTSAILLNGKEVK